MLWTWNFSRSKMVDEVYCGCRMFADLSDSGQFVHTIGWWPLTFSARVSCEKAVRQILPGQHFRMRHNGHGIGIGGTDQDLGGSQFISQNSITIVTEVKRYQTWGVLP